MEFLDNVCCRFPTPSASRETSSIDFYATIFMIYDHVCNKASAQTLHLGHCSHKIVVKFTAAASDHTVFWCFHIFLQHWKMKSSRVFIFFFIFQVIPYIADAIACIATTQGKCTGATYCTSLWNKQANGSWTPMAQGCLITSMVQNNLNKWQMPTPTTATYVCSVDNCNGPPTGNMPTSPPAPGYIQCIQPFASTKHCTSQSCLINIVNSITAQMCAYMNGTKSGKIVLGHLKPNKVKGFPAQYYIPNLQRWT